MAKIGCPLAHTANTMAVSKSRGRGQERGLRSAVERKCRNAGQAVGYGGRRLGLVVPGSRGKVAAKRMPKEMSEYSKNAEGSTLGAARKSRDELPHEDVVTVRVRKASVGNRVGRIVLGRSNERNIFATYFVSAVSQVSSLLYTKFRFVQG